MNQEFKIPPKSKESLTPPDKIIERLRELIGFPFVLSGKTRTDGSRIRKLVAATLEKYSLPEIASNEEFEIVPFKRKGIPKIAREFIDTYIVTSGISYNLQVWNRMPASQTLLVKYETGDSLLCKDVRFVFVKIDVIQNIVSSVILLTPSYIEEKFGRFGKPTIKHQLLISSKVRNSILESEDKILCFRDSKKLSYFLKHSFEPSKQNMAEEPSINEIYSVEILKEHVAKKLIGIRLESAATKTRGQALERVVLDLLGYNQDDAGLLAGGFPDIKNQLLEVKVQDAQTVDLGRFSPEKEETIVQENSITTFDIRYLIALTNPKTEVIEGVILAPGEKLGELFSYVSNESYKCQRTIPMSFFERFDGQAVFNPE